MDLEHAIAEAQTVVELFGTQMVRAPHAAGVVQLLNDAIPFLRAMQRQGHVQHYGMNSGWWDKTRFAMSRIHTKAKQVVKGAWQKLVESRRDKGPQIER